MGLTGVPAAPMPSKSITVILRPDEKKKDEAPWRGVIHDIHDMWQGHCDLIDALLHGNFTIWCSRIISLIVDVENKKLTTNLTTNGHESRIQCISTKMPQHGIPFLFFEKLNLQGLFKSIPTPWNHKENCWYTCKLTQYWYGLALFVEKEHGCSFEKQIHINMNQVYSAAQFWMARLSPC